MGNVLPFRRPEDPGDSETQPCPRCGHAVDRARVRCTRCGSQIVPGGGPPRRGLPGWMWIGVLLAVLVLLGWVLRG